ncbi:MAG: hypothetical protein J6M02_06460 [Clostridia bacterium]|nr:hypothetical protein [Clostridia bacterium]
MKAIRVTLCEERTLFGNPVIKTSRTEKGSYKKVLRKLKQEEYDVITLKEYNKKIVEYCNGLGIIPEEDETFLIEYFTKLLKKAFEEKGPLNLGVCFAVEDAKIAEKIIEETCVFCRTLSVPAYPRCRRLSEKIMRQNGLKINLENSLAKIEKKCDSIINVSNLKISNQEDDFS